MSEGDTCSTCAIAGAIAGTASTAIETRAWIASVIANTPQVPVILSVYAGARCLHHLAPFRDVGVQDGRELLRVGDVRLRALRRELVLHVLGLQQFVHVRIDLAHDV